MLPLIALMLFSALPVQAATLGQGAYEFETCDPTDCSLNGTWVVSDNGGQQYIVATGTTDYVEFTVQGQQLIIYRAISGGFADMEVCVDAICQIISNNNIATVYFAGVVIPLSGTNTIQIIGDLVYLDQFIVLDTPGGGGVFPTPVPTATAVPTTTPQPTSTPAPTATPISLVWAISPNSKYDMVAGQMVALDYGVSVGDMVLGILIFALLLMFIFKIFLDEGRKSR